MLEKKKVLDLLESILKDKTIADKDKGYICYLRVFTLTEETQ